MKNIYIVLVVIVFQLPLIVFAQNKIIKNNIYLDHVSTSNNISGTVQNLPEILKSDNKVSPNGPLTTLVNETFETGNSFTLVNGTQTNQWVRGTASPYAGSYSLYVSQNPGGAPPPNTYNINVTSCTHAYRDFTIPPGETAITISFVAKCYAEINYDFLEVSLVDNTVTPVAGSRLGIGSFGVIWGQTNFASFNLSASGTGTKRLVFTFYNDNSLGTMPPANVDNVVITSRVPSTITSTTTGGNWNVGSTWVGGVVPNGDHVIINGPVTVNQATSYVSNLTINAGKTLSVPYGTTNYVLNTLNVIVNGTLNLTSSANASLTGELFLASSSVSVTVNSGGVINDGGFILAYYTGTYLDVNGGIVNLTGNGDINLVGGGQNKLRNSGQINHSSSLTYVWGILFARTSTLTISGNATLTSNYARFSTFDGTNTIIVQDGRVNYNRGEYYIYGGTLAFSYTAGYPTQLLTYGGNVSYATSTFEWPTANSPYNVTVTNGTSTISLNGARTVAGTLSVTNGTFSNSAYALNVTTGLSVSAAGIFLNSGGTFIGGNFSVTNNGIIRQTAGTSTFGNTIGNSINLPAGGTLDVQGGTMNVAGRIAATGGSFLMSNGTLNLCTVGNGTATASFSLPNTSNITMSNGSLVLQRSNTGTGGDFNIVSGGTKTISGGTIQTGNASTPASSTFKFNSQIPVFNFTVFNTNSPTALLQNNFTINGAFTPTGGILDLGNYTLTLNGTIGAGTGKITSLNNSTVVIVGPATIPAGIFTGNVVQNLTINRAAGVALGGNVTVNFILSLTNGLLNTGSFELHLASSASDLIETSTKRVVGTTVMDARSIGAGLGLSFIGVTIYPGPDNMGNTVITRKTGTAGIITFNGNSGIQCNWTITPANSSVPGGRTVDYQWFSVYDNTINFTQNKAMVYYSTNSGTNFQSIGDSTVVSSDPRIITVTTTQFSIWTVGSANAPLPVRLQSFNFVLNSRDVKLNWITSSEMNNAGFEIQRTLSSIAFNDDWKNIGFVKGSGTKITPTEYSFTDFKLNTGKYKYRLKQIDFNGNYNFYNLDGNVEIGTPAVFELSQNYPNPFNPSTKIKFNLPLRRGVGGMITTLKIYNSLGQEIQTLVNESLSPGFYEFDWNASNLPSGTYFYILQSDDFVQTKKCLLIK
jgi:hypothetical protein